VRARHHDQGFITALANHRTDPLTHRPTDSAPPQKLLIKAVMVYNLEKSMQTITAFGFFKVIRLKRRVKASIPFVYTTSHRLYNILHYVAFPAVGGILSCRRVEVGATPPPSSNRTYRFPVYGSPPAFFHKHAQ
jgi:hypothetical protein